MSDVHGKVDHEGQQRGCVDTESLPEDKPKTDLSSSGDVRLLSNITELKRDKNQDLVIENHPQTREGI